MKKDLSALKNGDKKRKKVKNSKWILIITVLAFIISFVFSLVAELLLPDVSLIIGIIIVFLFIIIGVLFDMVGVSVASADEAPFHSMASQKVKGASLAIKLIKNASKVSSFCNDVIGDICGIVSGSAGVTIALKLAEELTFNPFFVSLFVTALIAAMTIGGKACGKSLAINKSNMILYRVTSLISIRKK